MSHSDLNLRKQLIRLAHTHPEFQADILPLLKGAGAASNGGFPPDSIGERVKGPDGVPGSDAQKPWAKGEFTQQENEELDEKQEKGQLSDGKADPAGKSASDDIALRAFRMARKAGKSQEAAVAFAKKARAAAAKPPARLTGKKLEKAIDKEFYAQADGVQFNIMDLGKLSKEVAAAYEGGGELADAMKAAVAKFRQN